MKGMTFISVFMLMLFTGAHVSASDENLATTLSTLETQTLVARSLQEKINNIDYGRASIQRDYQHEMALRRSLAIQLIKEPEAAGLPHEALATDFIRYYRAYLQAMADNYTEA